MESNIDLKFNEIDLEKVKKFKNDIDDRVETLKSEMDGPFELQSKTTIKKLSKETKNQSKRNRKKRGKK